MPENTSIPTLEQVAQRSGVTKGTASRILNGRLSKTFSVRPEVRQRVELAARELNYRPDLLARTFRQERTRLVAILRPHGMFGWTTNLYRIAIEGISQVMSEYNLDIWLKAAVEQTPENEMPPWRIDGAIILHRLNDATRDQLQRSQVPHTVLNGPAGPDGRSVWLDDAHGMQQAVEHLATLGHQRIAYCNALPFEETHSSITQRQDAYAQAMQQAGLKPLAGFDRRPIDADSFLEKACKRQRATAVIGYSHVEALDLRAAVMRLGLSVPDDISMITYNDEFFCSRLYPAQSCIDLQAFEAGKAAAFSLLDQMDLLPFDQSPYADRLNTAGDVMLPQSLALRDSTAPPEKPETSTHDSNLSTPQED